MSTKGRALITGASSGFGAEFARQLAAQGYDLLLIARREERMRQLADELSAKHGITTEVIKADLTDDGDIAHIVDQIASMQDLTLLVNNAGFNKYGPYDTQPLEVSLSILKLHVETMMKLTYAALPGMKERQQGAIINVSSFSGLFPWPNSATYSATKAYLVFFSEALAYELADHNVQVQALCPGFSETEIIDVVGTTRKQMGLPDLLWIPVKQVVSDSIKGLEKKKTLVVPSLPYQILWRLWSFRPFGHVIKKYLSRYGVSDK